MRPPARTFANDRTTGSRRPASGEPIIWCSFMVLQGTEPETLHGVTRPARSAGDHEQRHKSETRTAADVENATPAPSPVHEQP